MAGTMQMPVAASLECYHTARGSSVLRDTFIPSGDGAQAIMEQSLERPPIPPDNLFLCSI